MTRMRRRSLFALSVVLLLSATFQPTLQDVYLHNMRGSNNRLNEKSATRANNNRVFDSQVRDSFWASRLITSLNYGLLLQNNARGGYNVGDATSQPFTTEDGQYQMVTSGQLGHGSSIIQGDIWSFYL